MKIQNKIQNEVFRDILDTKDVIKSLIAERLSGVAVDLDSKKGLVREIGALVDKQIDLLIDRSQKNLNGRN